MPYLRKRKMFKNTYIKMKYSNTSGLNTYSGLKQQGI